MNTALKFARYMSQSKFPQLIFGNKIKYNVIRHVHTSQNVYVKMFMEHENDYAYSIMENKGYAVRLQTPTDDSLLTKEDFERLLQTDWSKTSPHQIFETFSVLGTYCSQNELCISNKMFDNYIDHLTDNLKHASDDCLKSIFYSLAKWPETDSIRTRNYIEVWAALDDECWNRLKNWSVDEMLSMMSLFYFINVTRVSDFSTKCLLRLASKAKQLTPAQLVQTMFFIGINRKSPHDMHNLEVHLENNFSKFTLEELAIMSMGFFKSKTPIRSMRLVTNIIDKIIERSSEVHEVSLAALLKVIRYSKKYDADNKIYELLDVMQHEAPRISVMCNVHLALLGTATLTLHEECLSVIAKTILDSMPKARMKDIERLVFTYGTFNFRPKTQICFFNKVIDEIRKPERQPEIDKYGRSFACCVSFLGLLGIYPVDLINKVLSPDFLLRTYGKHVYNYGKEILTVQNTANIFCPNEVNSLSENYVRILAKKYTDYVPNDNYPKQYNITEKFVIDVMKILKERCGGDEYVIGDHILSHHQRGDVIVCNSHKAKPMTVKDAFDPQRFGTIRQPPDDNLWVVLVIAGRNGVISNTGNPTGPFLSKIRELKRLGFHAALVPWNEYSSLLSASEKSDYLDSLITKAIKSE